MITNDLFTFNHKCEESYLVKDPQLANIIAYRVINRHEPLIFLDYSRWQLRQMGSTYSACLIVAYAAWAISTFAIFVRRFFLDLDRAFCTANNR
jgi:hypothetical protein